MRARIPTRWVLLAFVAAWVGAAVPAAWAHHPSVTEVQAGLTPDSGPWGIVSGPEGRLWFTEDGLSAFGSLTAVVRAGHSYLAPRGPHSARRRH